MAGLMDELNKAAAKLHDGVKELLDKTDIDEKVVGAAKDLRGKAQELLDKTDVDEKVVSAAKDLKGKAEEVISRAKPGVEDAFGKAAQSARTLFDKSMEKLQDSGARDAMDKIGDEVNAQVEKIRAAATGTNSIHDFIQNKYHPAEQPAAEETPAAEAPVTEEAPAEEEAPVTEEAPAEEEIPATEEAPAEEETPATEETPEAEETPEE